MMLSSRVSKSFQLPGLLTNKCQQYYQLSNIAKKALTIRHFNSNSKPDVSNYKKNEEQQLETDRKARSKEIMNEISARVSQGPFYRCKWQQTMMKASICVFAFSRTGYRENGS